MVDCVVGCVVVCVVGGVIGCTVDRVVCCVVVCVAGVGGVSLDVVSSGNSVLMVVSLIIDVDPTVVSILMLVLIVV